MEYGLIGEKLGHSFSKIIHEKIASYNYELKEISRDDIDLFMKKKDFKCINVTIPYKETVIPYLDFISSEAKEIGAINTIVNKNGKLYGYNTDYYGLRALIEKNGIDVKGKTCLILGSGGTSKTARCVLKQMDANNIYFVSRNKRDGFITYEEAKEIRDVNIIINTTPCGMYPNNEGLIIDINSFPSLEAVIDCIYNPLRTNLIISAKKRGLKCDGGLYMLVSQAVKSIEYFLDKKIDSSVIDKTYNDILKQKENIVLVGMPSCGKSTIGTQISEELNRSLFDTDKIIVNRIGMPIKDYFEKFGEKEFRKIEIEVVKEVSKLNSVVISTGGGVVLSEENMNALRQNGLIVYINRSLELLKPTSSRPLSHDIDSLKKVYEERKDIYKSVSDVEIKNDYDDFSLASAELLNIFSEERK